MIEGASLIIVSNNDNRPFECNYCLSKYSLALLQLERKFHVEENIKQVVI